MIAKTILPSADDVSVPIVADHYGSAEIMFVRGSALHPRLKHFELTSGVASTKLPRSFLLYFFFVIDRAEPSKTSNLRSKLLVRPNGAYFDRRR